METADRDNASDEFTTGVLDSFRQIFWEPEIARRGGEEVTGPLRRAVAILRPGAGVAEVRLNDEADLVARVRVTRAVQAGEPITVADVEALEDLCPANLDPDAGWAAMVTLPNGHVVAAFDFRRNRARATALLDLADQYEAAATGALERRHLGPALDAAFTCAELAVTAMMFLQDDDPLGPSRSRHSRRVGWLRNFTRLDNAPRAYHGSLARLADLRPAARYGSPPLTITEEDAAEHLSNVQGLLEHARLRVGELRVPVELDGVPRLAATPEP
ncbi:hypothetical protein [Actinotalea subterranea]|uniref:hypothetical protein n=1 Tax=Actinotalea subterranea TaxID=2607497 RepID=UPI0011EC992E|nr:hypothetical protein [Actinotalea subterranea]